MDQTRSVPFEQTSHDLELLVDVSKCGRSERSDTIRRQLRTAVVSGRLAAGERLPSSRSLAERLGVSRATVVTAYELLIAEGFLRSVPGGHTAVGDIAAAAAMTTAVEPAGRVDYDFRPGRPDVADFPRAAWRRAYTKALSAAPDELFGYPDPQGNATLRERIATYLARARGCTADPHRIVIVSGVAQGLNVAARLLQAEHRGATIAVEDPGSTSTISLLGAAGLRCTPVEVDDHGIRVDQLGAQHACLVTPAHQYPTGSILSARRRHDLVAWARSGSLIIEDDYDAEFRYDHAPISALQGLEPDRVIYLNSVSKTLSPAFRLGWMLVPAHLVDDALAHKHDLDLGNPEPHQAAFAEFLASGDYERHVQRQRRSYRRRRDALVEALHRHVPQGVISGEAAGLHLVLELSSDTDDQVLTASAAEADIAVQPLSPHGQLQHRSGLVLGYGRVPLHRIEPGIAALASLVGDAERRK